MMKNPLSAGMLLAVLLVAFGLPVSAFSATHALLIGIADYRQTEFSSLDGPLNDLDLTKTVLVRHFNIPTNQITVLTNARATHQAIQNAFARLADKVQTGDLVYIHYSGHGSEMTDLNHDETSGMDQTWVPYGARSISAPDAGLDSFDIIDDELHQWLIPIAEKSAYVVLVSDSCHSASITRSPLNLGRALPPDRRRHPKGGQPAIALPPNVLSIGAAMDDQNANEFINDEGMVFGLFTWHWCQALSSARPDETWDDVFQRACLLLADSVGWRQMPQRTGAANRGIFNGAFPPPSKVVRVTGIMDQGKTVALNAGRLTGVTKGSVYQIQNGNEKSIRLTISRVKESWSMGRLSHGSARIGDGFVESIHVYPFKPIKVFIGGDFAQSRDREPIRQLYSRIDGLPQYKTVYNQAVCDLVLYLLRPKACPDGQSSAGGAPPLPRSDVQAPLQAWFLSPDETLLADNLRIDMTDIAEGLRLVEENLGKLARIKEMDRLPRTPVDQFALTVQATLYRLDPTCKADDNTCVAFDPKLGMHRKQTPIRAWQLDGLHPRKGDVLDFTFENRSDREWYTYLVEIQPNGHIAAIFPAYQNMASRARLGPGKKIDLMNDVGVGVILDNIGKDKLRFIITRKPINIQLLEQRAFKTRAINPLEQLLGNAAHGMRGETAVSVDDWQSIQVDFQVDGSF